MKKLFARPLIFLSILLLVALVASLGASLVQNSFFGVKVSRVSFEPPVADAKEREKELSGLLYLPRGVDKDNPAPAVVLTHGYLNNKEMQEIGAIELSRRGYVVLAFDQYDHGDSTWDTKNGFTFWLSSVNDAVQWIYEQDYVLKDAAGNGMIGVSGHSMGGFSSEMAVFMDEMAAAVIGYRKIAASLAVGADFSWTTTFGVPFDMLNASFATRSSGVIAAQWDQFFFDVNAAGETVAHKNYVKDANGSAFLGNPADAKAGEFYDKDGGQRVIYTPNETHPQNTWSLKSGKHTIEFFEEAFKYQLNLYGLGTLESHDIKTGSTGQVWWLKEAFTLVALLALVLMIFPLYALVSKIPVFNWIHEAEEKANEEENAPNEVEESAPNSIEPEEVKANKQGNGLGVVKWVIIALSTLLSVYYLTRFMNRDQAELQGLLDILRLVMIFAIIIIIGLWFAAIISKRDDVKKSALNGTLYGALVIGVVIGFRWLINNDQIIRDATLWPAPSVNDIVYWAMCSGLLILVITFATKPLLSGGETVENPFGLKVSGKQFLGSVITALLMVAGLLLFVFLVGAIFKTDFRFYTYAIQIFNGHQFVAALKYIPLFFIYYFAAGISVFANTRGMKRGWVADLLAVFLLAGPVILFLIYQYAILYGSGTAAYPSFALSSILCVGLVPTLAIAAVVTRRISAKSGNIWASVIFNTVFFTIITLANTAVYQIAIG